LGRNENKRGKALLEKIQGYKKKTDEYLDMYGLAKRDILQLDRELSKAKL
jgi:acyl-CoA dehydrogenase